MMSAEHQNCIYKNTQLLFFTISDRLRKSTPLRQSNLANAVKNTGFPWLSTETRSRTSEESHARCATPRNFELSVYTKDSFSNGAESTEIPL